MKNNKFQFFGTKPFPVNNEQGSLNLTDKSQIGFMMIDNLLHTLVLKQYVHILNYQLSCSAHTQMVSKIISYMNYNHFYGKALFAIDKLGKTHSDFIGFTK